MPPLPSAEGKHREPAIAIAGVAPTLKMPKRLASSLIRDAASIHDIFAHYHLASHLPLPPPPPSSPPTVPTAASTPSPAGVSLSFYHGPALPPSTLRAMLASMLALRPLYDDSRMDWNEAEKRRELRHAAQRHIVANAPSDDKLADGHGLKKAVAFLSFRWLIDEGRPVMYVYELFVDPAHRGNGIGIALMKLAQHLCIKARIPAILLTVFDANAPALALYQRRLDFVNDETCPTRWDIHDAGYQILIKRITSADDSDTTPDDDQMHSATAARNSPLCATPL